ncbi:murein biosynthesis integral membrane protein MurJ [Streptomyces qinzhouensis]|uniref:Murein biosynthesis integral membrane protein MurJ n=2 Tax=Streptomyces qinzhouensis TaxID=2599401 RepID=A0A5B8JFF1_9ACTN|nr:murein biosynthesis integral membrane protein MurJ [Streptomyces qinzhouensis]QDY80347.1 murein biosynthesis integral membrane protein MurJ [Streptomyces qinzhouensis]
MGETAGRGHQPRAVPGVPGVSGTPVSPAHAAAPPAPETGEKKASSVARSGALMAAGSLVSRATGFVRSAVVAAALGIGLTADGYAVANAVPMILYMLLVGGALNAVFVPELVRAAKEHTDGGTAYTQRLLTVCAVALLVITGAAVAAAPQIVAVYTGYSGAQAEMTVAFARYCLPQIFFLGLFTVLGQVLNARDRFGAMMWTPVLNNIVVISVFGLYLVTGDGGALSSAERALLGWGTTAGIALQALALAPALRRAGFRWRPRFDWRGSGLTRPLRAAGWLVLLVLSNQAAYWVVTRLATMSGRRAAEQGIDGGAGFSAYTNAYTLWAVPHGIITVSLVTALLPRMSRAAADDDPMAVRRDVSYALRTSASMIVPAACALLALAQPVMTVVYGYGQTDPDDVALMAGILMAFAPGLVAFSGQYVLSRAFYALSDTRTPFFLNLVIVAVNAGLAVTAYLLLPARWVVTGLAGAYSAALLAGWLVTALVLRRRLLPPPVNVPGQRGRHGRRSRRRRPEPLWRSASAGTVTRLLVAAVPAAGLGHLTARVTGEAAGAPAAGVAGAVVIGAVFVALARPLRLTELDTAVSGAVRRLRRRPARG